MLLRSLSTIRDEKELSRATNVDEKEVTRTLDELFERGYIGQDSFVTEKGFDLLNQSELQLDDGPDVKLSSLELLVLKESNKSMNDKLLSKLLKVDVATVSAKLDRLHELGLISKKLMLTAAGFNILNSPAVGRKDQVAKASHPPIQHTKEKTQEPPSKVVVIQREIVKVPCRYCGTLLDPARDSKCSSCGAKVSL